MKRFVFVLTFLFGFSACATARVGKLPDPKYVCSVPGAPTAYEVIDLEDARDACVARVQARNEAAMKEAEAEAEAKNNAAVGWMIIVIGAIGGGVAAVVCGTGNCVSDDGLANRRVVPVAVP